MKQQTIDINLANKVKNVLSFGLTCGLGKPIPGNMCVEAAVCYAMGMDHSDKPKCVGLGVRDFKITLNDDMWSSNMARAKGMLKIAIAQLGSDQIDQEEFALRCCLLGATRLLPEVVLRVEEESHVSKAVMDAVDYMKEISGDYSASAASEIYRLLRVIRFSDSVGHGCGATAAVVVIVDSLSLGTRLLTFSDPCPPSICPAATQRAINCTMNRFPGLINDEVLELVADIGLQVLMELKSPGCEFLSICE